MSVNNDTELNSFIYNLSTQICSWQNVNGVWAVEKRTCFITNIWWESPTFFQNRSYEDNRNESSISRQSRHRNSLIFKTFIFSGQAAPLCSIVFSNQYNIYIYIYIYIYISFIGCWSLDASGSRSWTLGKFEMCCWRRMEKISWTDHVTNEEILLKVKEHQDCRHTSSHRTYVHTPNIMAPHQHIDFYIFNKF